MNDCVFCRIVNSELPAYKIFEDNEFVVILDRFPACPGHTLIIPKTHAEDIYALTPETASAAFGLAARIAPKLKKALNCDGLNVLQNNGSIAGQSVQHFHIHLIPRFKDDGIMIKWNTIDPPPELFSEILGKLSICATDF